MQNDKPSLLRSRQWIAFLVAPIVYVLSVAPTLCVLDFLDKRDVLSYESETKLWDAWRAFYVPLDLASERSEYFSQALEWYVHSFCERF